MKVLYEALPTQYFLFHMLISLFPKNLALTVWDHSHEINQEGRGEMGIAYFSRLLLS